MQNIIRQSEDWRVATAHLDIRHIPTGTLFRLTPKIVIDPSSGYASRDVVVYPYGMGNTTYMPAIQNLEILCAEASAIGALLYGFFE